MFHEDILLYIKVCFAFFAICFLSLCNWRKNASFIYYTIKMHLVLIADYSKDFSKTMVSTVSIAMNSVRNSQEELW